MSIREELNKLLKKNNRFMILTLAQKTFDVGPTGFSAISGFGHKDEVPALILAKEEGLFDYGACLRKDGDKYIAPTKDSVLEALEKAKAKKAVPEDMDALGLDQKDFLKVFPYAKPAPKEDEKKDAPKTSAKGPKPPSAKTQQNENAIEAVVRILTGSLTQKEYVPVMKEAGPIGRLTTSRIKTILELGVKKGVWSFDDDLTITREGEAELASEEADVPPGEPDEGDVDPSTAAIEEVEDALDAEVEEAGAMLAGELATSLATALEPLVEQVVNMRHAMDNAQFYQRVQGSRTEMGVRMLDQKVMALADLIVSVGQIVDMGFGGDGYEAEAELMATIKEPLPAIQQGTVTGRVSSAAPNQAAKPRSDEPEAEEEGNEESIQSSAGDESSTKDSSDAPTTTDNGVGVPDVYAIAKDAGNADVFYKAVMKDYNIDTLRSMCHKVGIQSNSSFKSALANLLKQHVESKDIFTE